MTRPLRRGSAIARPLPAVSSIDVNAATLLVLVVSVALTVAQAELTGNLVFGPIEVGLSARESLLAAAVVLTLLLGVGSIAAAVDARLTSSCIRRARDETFSSYVNASWAMQSRERAGAVQELLTVHVARTGFAIDSLATLVQALLRIRSVADLELLSGGLPTLAVIPEVDKGHDAAFVAGSWRRPQPTGGSLPLAAHCGEVCRSRPPTQGHPSHVVVAGRGRDHRCRQPRHGARPGRRPGGRGVLRPAPPQGAASFRGRAHPWSHRRAGGRRHPRRGPPSLRRQRPHPPRRLTATEPERAVREQQRPRPSSRRWPKSSMWCSWTPRPCFRSPTPSW